MDIDTENMFMMYINSNQRVTGGTPQNFFIEYLTPRDKDFNMAVCLQAAIPKSYYMVLSGSNEFYLSEDGGSNFVEITVPEGNYNISSFLVVLKDLLDIASPNGNTYTITYPNIAQATDTGKLTFTTSGAQTTIFRFINEFGIHYQMGFRVNGPIGSFTDYTFTAQSLTSNHVINLQPSKSVYITLDSVNDGVSNILQAVQNQAVGTMNIATYQCTTLTAWSKPYFGAKDNLFHFKLVDEFNNEIDTNGQEWSCAIMLYKKQNLPELIKKFIQYITMKTE